MLGAIFGLIGVLVGSGISWFRDYWTDKKANDKNARYLAIRVVCILDKFLEDYGYLVKERWGSFEEQTIQGYLSAHVESPGPPVFPADVDWKSIDHELMYNILAFASEVEAGDRIIKATEDVAQPPHFEDWFNERKFHYSRFGLIAYKLSKDLCVKYDIRQKDYKGYDPEADLKQVFETVGKWRQKRMEEHGQFLNKVLGAK